MTPTRKFSTIASAPADHLEQGRASVFGLQIQADAVFVAIDALEIPAQEFPVVVRTEGADRPNHIPLGWLDLDHLGAVISEHHGRIGPGEHLRQVDDPDVAERARGFYLHQWLLRSIKRTTLDPCDER